MKYVTTVGEQEYVVDVLDDAHVSINGKIFAVDFHSVSDQPVYSLLVDGQSFEAYVYPAEDLWQVLLTGRLFQARVEDEREHRLRSQSAGSVLADREYHLKAPMPGLIVSVAVEEGQEVKNGEVLIILESMKMQNELKSPRDGVVSRLKVKAGDSVEQRQVILTVN